MKLQRKEHDNKLTAMMQVRNEADRYLREVLNDLSEYVDEIVIVDDASTDDTVRVCRSYAKVVSLERSTASLYGVNEAMLKIRLFARTAATAPDWILAIDADEIFEPRAHARMRDMINQTHTDWYSFRFFHFWQSRTHYRVDKLWAPTQFGPRLFRYFPDVHYRFNHQALHCGSIPQNAISDFRGQTSDLRIRHLGYAGSADDIRRKYAFYVARDPNSEFCPREHYESMLDEDPVCKPWHD